jgi:hypothetical protein
VLTTELFIETSMNGMQAVGKVDISMKKIKTVKTAKKTTVNGAEALEKVIITVSQLRK